MRQPGDSQYHYPHAESPLLIMRYGDGWAVYDLTVQRLYVGLDPNGGPIEFRSDRQAENFALMLFSRVPLSKLVM